MNFFFTGRLVSVNNRCYLLEEMLLELIQKYLNVLVYWNRNGDPLPFWSLLVSAWGIRLSILALNYPVSICMHLFISKLLFFSMSCYQPNPHKIIIRENYCLESQAAYCGKLSCCLCWLCIIKMDAVKIFYKKVGLFLCLSDWDSNKDRRHWASEVKEWSESCKEVSSKVSDL